jgi:hypothetical protein
MEKFSISTQASKKNANKVTSAFRPEARHAASFRPCAFGVADFPA